MDAKYSGKARTAVKGEETTPEDLDYLRIEISYQNKNPHH
jgi:hypothetical protein